MQFGRLVLVFEDGAGFITHHHILPRDQGDRDVVVEQTRTAQKRHRGKIRRGSFDRGFHSPQVQDELAKILEHPCVPMPGSKQAAEQEKTASVEFRNAQAVASGYRIGDRRVAVGQRAETLPRPDARRDLSVTSAWVCWGAIFMCWASC